MRHLFVHRGDEVALIVVWQAAEEGRVFDNVEICSDRERFRDLCGKQNVEIAFLDAGLVAFRPAEFRLRGSEAHEVVEPDESRRAYRRTHQRSFAKKRTAVAGFALAGYFRHTRSICVVHTLFPISRNSRRERSTHHHSPVRQPR